jgi:hypothetical protein
MYLQIFEMGLKLEIEENIFYRPSAMHEMKRMHDFDE